MMCGNIGFYFCKSSAGYESWWQDHWGQQEDTNGRSMHSPLYLFLFHCTLPSIFSLLSFYPHFSIHFFSPTDPLSLFFLFGKYTGSPEQVRDSSSEEQKLRSPSALLLWASSGNLSADGSQHQCQNRHQPCDSCSFGQRQIRPVAMPGRRKSIIWVS